MCKHDFERDDYDQVPACVWCGQKQCPHSIHGTGCEKPRNHQGQHSHSDGKVQWSYPEGVAK
jgi:hypothetical protein